MNIEELRHLCLSFPNVTEDIKWEKDLCFCIGEKMFAVTGLEEGHDKVSFKVFPEEYEQWISREGISPAPYLARFKWVTAEYPSMNKEEWILSIRQSYDLVRSKLSTSVRKKLD